MTIVQPRYEAPGLVRPDGSFSTPLANLLRALAGGTNDAATSATLSALADRVTVLESSGAAWTGHGENGIQVYGDAASGFTVKWEGTTTNVPEGLNLYFTDARARAAVVVDAITDAVTDHAPSQNAVFDALALKAPLASPAFTGNPTAPTPSPGDNDTSVATSAFVTAAVAAAIAAIPAGVPLVLTADYAVVANTQVLFSETIEIGTFNLDIAGSLIEVT